MDLAEARRRFAQAPVARLATVDPDGRPHLVPIVFALVGDGRRDVIYHGVDAKPKRSTALRRLRNIAGEPRVSVLADHYAEDWDTLWWVRADARARTLDPEGEEARRAVALLVARYPRFEVRGAMLAFDVTDWAWWAAVP